MGKNKTTSLKLHVPDASREMIEQCEKLVHNYTGNMTTTTVCEDGRDSGGTFLAGISMVTSKSSVDMTISLEEKPAIYLLERVLDIPADGEGVDVKLNEDKQIAADLAAFLYMLKGLMLPPVCPLYENIFNRIYTYKGEENTLDLVSISRLRDFLEYAEQIHVKEGNLPPDAKEFSDMILELASKAKVPAEPTAEQPAADQQQEPEKEATAPTPESGAEPPKPKKRGRPRKNPAPEAPAPGSEAKPATETVAEAVAPDTTPATDQQQEPEKPAEPKDAENGNNV